MGSPPQVRGKLRLTDSALRTPGITPAGAGKTQQRHGLKPPNRDHPRRCGENLRPLLLTSTATGSPPQVRGKQAKIADEALCIGITPAGAGKTPPILPLCGLPTDHPRRCGENFPASRGNHVFLGSPPQVRGKPQADCHVFRRQGITPAGAGKTLVFLNFCRNLEDHPRRCGENRTNRRKAPACIGSPPQVRGKHRRQPAPCRRVRITPAGAGKTIHS